MNIDHALVRSLPKVVLHDHLDGGLRPSTIVDLAQQIGYHELPTSDPDQLAAWFARAAHGGGLVQYLEGFKHTVAVMQTAESLNRVARECVHDFADDGVVYAEVRFAPELHTDGGLDIDSVLEAVLDGFANASAERGIAVYALLSAMRQGERSMETAEAAVRWRDRGVVGFDIAGPEKGFPPTQHLPAFQLVQRENFHSTIHAGEAFGLPSIWEALQWCNAERLGHGVRVVDDITMNPDGTASLGRLAAFVRDRRVPLEMCPTSNVNTGVAPSIAKHPIGLLHDLRFRVTVNTDNRLMSSTSMTEEMMALAGAFGYDLIEMEWFTVNAMKSAFAPFDERLALINGRIKPAYAQARARIALPG